MFIVIFECSENMNKKFKEEFEFEDDATEEEIEKEYIGWVWQEVGDNYCWYKKGE